MKPLGQYKFGTLKVDLQGQHLHCTIKEYTFMFRFLMPGQTRRIRSSKLTLSNNMLCFFYIMLVILSLTKVIFKSLRLYQGRELIKPFTKYRQMKLSCSSQQTRFYLFIGFLCLNQLPFLGLYLILLKRSNFFLNSCKTFNNFNVLFCIIFVLLCFS